MLFSLKVKARGLDFGPSSNLIKKYLILSLFVASR